MASQKKEPLFNIADARRGSIIGHVVTHKSNTELTEVIDLVTPRSHDHSIISIHVDDLGRKFIRLNGDCSMENSMDLLAINTFLYTNNIYSLPISTYTALDVGTLYSANETSYVELFADPKSHKASYDAYVKFTNYCISKLVDLTRKKIEDCSHAFGYSQRNCIYDRMKELFSLQNKFVYNDPRYTDDTPEGQASWNDDLTDFLNETFEKVVLEITT